ncbi:MAG TPA: hypothetical protein VGW40_15665 [Allosphingosinicella sp.]|nr:hypothetical protein [Allosphingosinicella sp.]
MRRYRAIAGALLALAACGRGGDEANRQAAPGAAQPPANITVTTPEGRAEVRTGGAAPGAIAAGIPAYPGATVAGTVDVTGASAEGTGHVVAFTTADPPAQVIGFYRQAAEAAGYRVAQQMNMGPTAMLTAARGESEGVTVTATRAGGTTQVQLVVGQGR